MRIVALDPGGTTGVAIYQDEFETDIRPAWIRAELGPFEHHDDLWWMLENEREVVYETFSYQRRPVDKGISLELVSKEYIGIIKLHGVLNGAELYPQSPPTRLFWKDKLEALGLWVPSPHERDATMHLLQHVTFTLKDKRFLNQLKA